MNYTEMTINELKEICKTTWVNHVGTITTKLYYGFSNYTKKADLIDFMTKCDTNRKINQSIKEEIESTIDTTKVIEALMNDLVSVDDFVEISLEEIKRVNDLEREANEMETVPVDVTVTSWETSDSVVDKDTSQIIPNYYVLKASYHGKDMYWTGHIWSFEFMYGKRITRYESINERLNARINGNWVLDDCHIHLVPTRLPSNRDVNYIQDEEQGE